jgi:hypothetical protein
VIIPLKYNFQKTDNQYRIQTISKVNLQNAGFTVYYATEEIKEEKANRCSLLNFDLESDNSFLITKLAVVFKDCFGKIIYKSPFGKSRQKEFELAYIEALNDAFKYISELNYKYSGSQASSSEHGTTPLNYKLTDTSSVTITTACKKKISKPADIQILQAVAIVYGYELVDSKKVIIKAYKTSNPTNFIAKKDNIQGTLISKENYWYFEYYENDQLISEKNEVRF